LTFGTKNADAIQIRRLTVSEGYNATGSGISWTWSSSGTDNETWAAIRVIMPGNSNSNMTFSTTPALGGGPGLTERMRITDTGNVGIGITNPGRKLDVLEGNVQIIANFQNTSTTSARIKFTDANTGAENVNIGAVGTRLALYTNNLERLSILSGGNVGIGTTSPAFKLSVDSATTATAQFNVNNNMIASFRSSTIASNAWAGIKMLGDEGSGIWFSDDSGANNHGYISQKYTGQMDFATGQDSSAAATVKMTILSGGNVGIGTTSPNYKLRVEGDIQAQGKIGTQDNSGIFLRGLSDPAHKI
jgi:hypothetical protein